MPSISANHNFIFQLCPETLVTLAAVYVASKISFKSIWLRRMFTAQITLCLADVPDQVHMMLLGRNVKKRQES
ncbi:MAG: hypothetical protein ACJA0N_001684 [Pseudohongiellaceae bacterium]|jgi:hypothetical protein